MRRLAPACLATIVIAALAFAPSAGAGTVEMAGTTAVFTAALGELNDVDAELTDDGSLQLSDTNPVRVSGNPSCLASGSTIDCSLGATALRLELGDGDDRARVTGADTMPLTVDGGDGEDELTVTGEPVTLIGGSGDDLLDATGLGLKFAGGPGNDLIRNRAAASVDCTGGGLDRAFRPQQLKLSGCPAPARVKAKVPKGQTLASLLTVGLEFSATCSRPCAIGYALVPDKATRKALHNSRYIVASQWPADAAGYPDLAPAGQRNLRTRSPVAAIRKALKRAGKASMTLELTATDGLAVPRPTRVKVILR